MELPEVLFGGDLGAGVVAPAVDVDAEGCGFVEDESLAVRVAVGADAGDVDEAFDVGLEGGVGEVVGGVDGVLLEGGPGAPIADLSSGVVDDVDAFAGGLATGRVGEVAHEFFDGQGIEKSGVGSGSDEGAYGPACFVELFDDVASQEPGSAGD